jgi:hypothetical protein
VYVGQHILGRPKKVNKSEEKTSKNEPSLEWRSKGR